MFFGNKLLAKAVSATLVVFMLCIHSVKLLHTHSVRSLLSHDLHKTNVAGKNAFDCSICDYQVNKDSDSPAAFEFEGIKDEYATLCCHLNFNYKRSFHSGFENRGPPVI